ncbi:MAG: hypothetical protein GOMPHAMPRED_002950 [Gomphillus americanus]|uniref:Arf-GAP domain-containing protein n=1 Tax=Gomphillus americanus TaxID=1940652 RepID=A0A8H3I4V8_9LECA|nr:MAG: hypothetical protein GOMPHAMPRED_002950 [Gomphillus americanus]
MSRRTNDRAAQNQATLKNLVKLESNKSCADCKRNKHPRWASWNLGIFVCIRCSGIHRGMGTHISRVKSVDLDAWTDEQLESVVKWGNARANKYWEAKLAPGHVPAEARIENFIRTKYESKRWVMDGPMPDPSTLAEGDDLTPPTSMKEKSQIQQSSSQRTANISQPAPPPKPQPASFDLIGGDELIPPARPSTTGPPAIVKPPPPKQQQPSQLLGGLDFLGDPPERPSSASSMNNPGGLSRPDLKQSILSLYATAPKPQTTTLPSHDRQASTGGSQSTTKPSAFGDLSDAFGGLNFSTAPGSSTKNVQASPPQSQPSLFPNLSGPSTNNKAMPVPPQFTKPPQAFNPPPLAGGSFFDTGPKPPPKPAPPKQTAPPPLVVRKASNASDGFGEFSSAFNPSAPNTAPITASSIAASTNGLLGFSPTADSVKPVDASQSTNSVFNLSAPKTGPASNYNALMQTSAPPTKTTFKTLSSDPWASNEWNTNEPAVATPVTGLSVASPTLKSATGADFGWGSSPLPTSNTTSSNAPPNWAKSNTVQPDWSKSTAAPAPASTSTQQSGWGSVADIGGWGDPTPPASTTFPKFNSTPAAPPKITPEDDFGDWGSAPAPLPTPGPAASSTGGQAKVASEDLWGNVWE